MLHNESVGRVRIKECYFIFTYTSWHFLAVFYQKTCVFITFSSFLMKYRISATKYRPTGIVSGTVCLANCHQKLLFPVFHSVLNLR